MPGAASSMRQGGACLLRGAPFPLPQPFCSAAAMLGAVRRARAGGSAAASGAGGCGDGVARSVGRFSVRLSEEVTLCSVYNVPEQIWDGA